MCGQSPGFRLQPEGCLDAVEHSGGQVRIWVVEILRAVCIILMMALAWEACAYVADNYRVELVP